MTKQLICPIVGMHTSGKTTLLNYFKNEGYAVEEELAEIIRIKNNCNAGANGQNDFEELVMLNEKRRDLNRTGDHDVIIIESWHILTIAYMYTKEYEDKKISEYYKYVRNLLNNYYISVIYLDSDTKLILKRGSRFHNEDDIVQISEFYDKLNKNIYRVIKELNLDYIHIDSTKPKELVAANALKFINKKTKLLS